MVVVDKPAPVDDTYEVVTHEWEEYEDVIRPAEKDETITPVNSNEERFAYSDNKPSTRRKVRRSKYTPEHRHSANKSTHSRRSLRPVRATVSQRSMMDDAYFDTVELEDLEAGEFDALPSTAC